MSSVQEIETALMQLPPQERWEVARWLLEDLQRTVPSPSAAKSPSRPVGKLTSLPDYAARRQRIFGDKILPNMVLAARAEERR